MNSTFHHINQFLRKPVYSASLSFFRIVFGLMLAASMLRFWGKGWIKELYIDPVFYFKYHGFEWVQNWNEYTPLLFLICGISALFFALGFFYRISSVVLFLSFTYIELLDKTNYLNHYYFVSLALFLMIWLPANANLSVDNILFPATSKRSIPRWTTGSIRLLLGIVYFYAGLAKLNPDWMLQALPLKIWLPAKNDLPLIGGLFNYGMTAYLFSWFGALYDLSIPFFLLYSKTRKYAYLVVIIFHLTTAVLFPIGMFPYVMITSAVIFFNSADIDRFFLAIKRTWKNLPVCDNDTLYRYDNLSSGVLGTIFTIFFTFQILFPFRFLLYPGKLFWTEQGYRFSWRVMLIEKMGYAQFIVKDAVTGRAVGVNNNEFLTRNQEKMMATQPDFILQYAAHLQEYYQARGMKDPAVYATVYVSLNGRRSRLFINPDQDLTKVKDDCSHQEWILPAINATKQ